MLAESQPDFAREAPDSPIMEKQLVAMPSLILKLATRAISCRIWFVANNNKRVCRATRLALIPEACKKLVLKGGTSPPMEVPVASELNREIRVMALLPL